MTQDKVTSASAEINANTVDRDKDMKANFERQVPFTKKFGAGLEVFENRYANVNAVPMAQEIKVTGFDAKYDADKDLTGFTMDFTTGLQLEGIDLPETNALEFVESSFSIHVEGNQLEQLKGVGFGSAVAFTLLQGLVVPASVISNTAEDFETVIYEALKSARILADEAPEGLREGIIAQDNLKLTALIAYFAWSDRVNMYRNIRTNGFKPRHLDNVFNPMQYIGKPEFVLEFAQYEENLAIPTNQDTALVSLSWGKESLLGCTLAQEIYGYNEETKQSNVIYGVIGHDLNTREYQDAYSRFIADSPLADGVHTTARSNYLGLLHKLIPGMTMSPKCGPTNGLHQMYGMLHILNNWNRTNVVYMGDEAERTVDNAVYQHVEAVNAGFKKSPIRLGFEIERAPSDVVARENSVTNPKLWTVVGQEHTFDFHQSQHMAISVNAYMQQVLGVKKWISSLIYPVTEMQIQYLLAKLNPELYAFQVSCWFADDPREDHGSKWCCSCKKCWRLYQMLKSLGLDPEGTFGLKVDIPKDEIIETWDKLVTGGTMFAVDGDLGEQSRYLVDRNVLWVWNMIDLIELLEQSENKTVAELNDTDKANVFAVLNAAEQVKEMTERGDLDHLTKLIPNRITDKYMADIVTPVLATMTSDILEPFEKRALAIKDLFETVKTEA